MLELILFVLCEDTREYHHYILIILVLFTFSFSVIHIFPDRPQT